MTVATQVAGPGSAERADPGRRRRRRGVTTRVPPVIWVFLLVPLLVELVWVFWPAFNSFQLSFTKWSGRRRGPAGRAGQLSQPARRPGLHDRDQEQRVLGDRVRRALGDRRARPRGGAQQAPARGRALSQRDLSADGVLARRDRPVLAGALPAGRADQHRARRHRHRHRTSTSGWPTRTPRCGPSWSPPSGGRSATSWCSTWPG